MSLAHLAAPNRKAISPLISSLIRRKILTLDKTLLDYGCGYAFDVDWLADRGYNAVGFDPHYRPQRKLKSSSIVVLNYVLNVIQDVDQRIETLLNAWALAEELLIISVPVNKSGESISDRGVFCKTYGSIEFKGFIESSLGRLSMRFGRDKLIVRRDSPIVAVRSRDDVLKLECDLQSRGYCAPAGTTIQRYSTGYGLDRRYSYYRLVNLKPVLQNPKTKNYCRCLSLGHENSPQYWWGVESIERGHRLLQAKFHCADQSFLSEFEGNKSWRFLSN